MSIQAQSLEENDYRTIMCICVLAAFADGTQDEVERAQIERIVKGFAREGLDLTSAYQDALSGNFSLMQVGALLQSPSARTLANEMATCVCYADGALNEKERQFLADLRQALQLDPGPAEINDAAQILIEQPLATPPPPVIDAGREADLDRMILNTSILSGALEIMPQTIATMAVIPVQMRMVYQIGKRYGYELDRGHIKDFLATMGVGLTSQVVEGFTRRLIGGFTRKLAGGLAGGLARQAAGSAFAFATTYALGQVAKRYYASGRTLNTAQLKDVFASMLDEARSMQGRYSGEIAQKSRGVNIADVVSLVKQQ